MPTGAGEECVDEFDEFDVELESGTWNAGTDCADRRNSGVVACSNRLGLVVRRGFEGPGKRYLD